MFLLSPCCIGEKVAPLGAALQGLRSCYFWGLWPACSEICPSQLPFDLFPCYSNTLIPELANFHCRRPLLHRLGSPVAPSSFHEKPVLLSSPQVLKVAEFFPVVSSAWPPSLFPEPASASLCSWACFCFLQVWRNPDYVAITVLAFLPHVSVPHPSGLFLALVPYVAFSLGLGERGFQFLTQKWSENKS